MRVCHKQHFSINLPKRNFQNPISSKKAKLLADKAYKGFESFVFNNQAKRITEHGIYIILREDSNKYVHDFIKEDDGYLTIVQVYTAQLLTSDQIMKTDTLKNLIANTTDPDPEKDGQITPAINAMLKLPPALYVMGFNKPAFAFLNQVNDFAKDSEEDSDSDSDEETVLKGQTHYLIKDDPNLQEEKDPSEF